ncbi:MAG TPA: protein kinase [Kofleriaceae bacterium]|nr:protein kinase [Kofleriaceae bacterium]
MSTAHDLTSAFACLAPGAAIGRYRILRRIAVGGMAEIYLATASGIEGFEKRVAIKRILPSFASIPEFVGMFLDEARLAGRLHHPNIAQVYDIGSDGDSYYFAMEHVDGRDVRHLRKALRARAATMPLEHALAITMGCAAGLHAAHETRGHDGALLRVVHRDVSPANILVGFDGSVKLVDFGIARSDRRQTQTRVGVLKGKTCHMSPEQCLGEPLDRRSDVYSLGILLYELTTDSRLFGAETEYETMRLIVEGRIPPPALRRPGYPTALEDIVMRALERAPEDRYQTAGEMYVALERFARVQGLRVDPFSLASWVAELCPPTEVAVTDGSDAPPLFLVPERELPELHGVVGDDGAVEITGEFEEEPAFERMETVERASAGLAVVGRGARAVSPDSDAERDRKATVSLHSRDDGEELRPPSVQPEADPPTALIEMMRRPAPARRGLGAMLSVIAAAAAGAAVVWLAVRLVGGGGKTAAAEAEAPPVVVARAAPADKTAPVDKAAPAPVLAAPVASQPVVVEQVKPVTGTPVEPKLVRRKVRKVAKKVEVPAVKADEPKAAPAEPKKDEPKSEEPATPAEHPAPLLDVPVQSPDI